LSGPLYPSGIPIYAEEKLEKLILEEEIQQVIFAYSDVSHVTLMHLASRVLSRGADVRLIGPEQFPFIIAPGDFRLRRPYRLREKLRGPANFGARSGSRLGPVVVRHPMPYGDLNQQIVQRFASVDDCDRQHCTIEEREEYEQHIAEGVVVYAGVDYAKILDSAEKEADIIVWDGGNNDWPFFKSDLEIVLVDPHRPGHELLYHPGETNLRRAQVIVVNKLDSAPVDGVHQVMSNIAQINPRATLIQARSNISVDKPEVVRGKRVLVIEDGPTLTHGEMGYGSGIIAAQRHSAAEIVDPRPFARGSLVDIYARYPWVGRVLPAMGYSKSQLEDLAATINSTPCDSIVVATPVDLPRLIAFPKPLCRVRYDLEEISHPDLAEIMSSFFPNYPMMRRR
jgi:predicted GTPase